MTSVAFDVFGRKVTVESTESGWRVWHHGADGKRRPADDIPIPRQLKPEEIESYLADLCHEWTTPQHPNVKRLT